MLPLILLMTTMTPTEFVFPPKPKPHTADQIIEAGGGMVIGVEKGKTTDVVRAVKALGFRPKYFSVEDTFIVTDSNKLTDETLAKIRKIRGVRYVESNPKMSIQRR